MGVEYKKKLIHVLAHVLWAFFFGLDFGFTYYAM